VAKDAANSTSKTNSDGYRGTGTSARAQPGRNAGGDDFIEDDEIDAEADYGED